MDHEEALRELEALRAEHLEISTRLIEFEKEVKENCQCPLEYREYAYEYTVCNICGKVH